MNELRHLLRSLSGILIALLFVHPTVASAIDPADYFRITVVDELTGRGVPLVELRTVNDVRCYTDSAGVVAFLEPSLMGQDVYFHVRSHGYEHARDGFGYRGARLNVTAGGKATLRLKRINIAERLYRVTGAGIYRDSVLLGDSVPLSRPLLNRQVLGSDSVVNAVYQGQIFWFWGDTNRAAYPLGNFHVPGATSRLPSDGGLDPAIGVDLHYFPDESGFVASTAHMPGEGPTWIDGLVKLTDESGRERLFAKYVKIKPPLTVYERGLAEFNRDTRQFEKSCQFDMNQPLFPGGHPFHHTDNGQEYIYFATPYPLIRVRATVSDLHDLSRYESWTCLKPGSREDSCRVDRDESGRLRFAWKADTLPLTQQLEKRLIADGILKADEAWFRLKDVASSDPVNAHSGSVCWNDFRQRWVMIFVESGGSSMLGEVWYSESTSPAGPWEVARKIATHDHYSFYNPKQHPVFDDDGGRVIYFEGTYTNTFSGNPDRTPRYNYNQIMYRLDLADPRLNLSASNTGRDR